MVDRRFSILVADESDGCREQFRAALEHEGYEVFSARSGWDALHVVRAERIHVLVMDLRLPDYTGVEIYHAIKDIRDTFLPCIFTAIETTPRSLRDALDEDAVTILPKPVDEPRLVHAVDWSIRKYYQRPSRLGPKGRD